MNARLREFGAAGLSVLNLMDLKTGEESVAGVMFKTDRRDRGILLNVCPFCSQPILFDERLRGERDRHERPAEPKPDCARLQKGTKRRLPQELST
jgi:hypothetical protein